MKPKHLVILALAALATWMASRAVKRIEAEPHAQIMAALWAVLACSIQLNAANTPKTRAIEDRLNSVIPTIFSNPGGTINGSVTTNGSHTVNGQVNSNSLSVSGNSSTGGSHTVGGQVNSNTLSVSGNATTGGTHTVHGGANVDGNVAAGGNVNGSTLSNSSGSTNEMNGGIHSGGSVVADGSLRAGNFSGSYAGGQGGVSTVGGPGTTYSQSYITTLASAINGCIARLNSSGVI